MLETMVEKGKNTGDTAKGKDTKHLGADVPADLADRFSVQCDTRGFKQKKVIEAVIEDWLTLPEAVQVDIYHGRGARRESLRTNIIEVLRELQLLPEPPQSPPRSAKR